MFCLGVVKTIKDFIWVGSFHNSPLFRITCVRVTTHSSNFQEIQKILLSVKISSSEFPSLLRDFSPQGRSSSLLYFCKPVKELFRLSDVHSPTGPNYEDEHREGKAYKN